MQIYNTMKDFNLDYVYNNNQPIDSDILQEVHDEWLFSSHLYNNIVDDCFKEDGPITLNKLEHSEYEQIPIFRQTIALYKIIEEAKSLKLTATESLPTKVVEAIYNIGVLNWHNINYPKKRKIESDFQSVHLAKILLEVSGITKKKKNALSITKKGEKIFKDKHLFLKEILNIFCYKFRWSYLDGFEHPTLAQNGFGFSLILMAKYGKQVRESKFYSRIFFYLLNINQLSRQFWEIDSCYSFRTFEVFMQQFGLIKIEPEEGTRWMASLKIEQSPLFDKLIKINNNFGKINLSTTTNVPIYRLFIKLAEGLMDTKDSFPLVWREFLVPSNILLRDLHVVIQKVMGWSNSHLHQFAKDKTIYGEKFDEFGIENQGIIDYKEIRLSDLLKTAGDKLKYLYDFGDCWTHSIELLGVVKPGNKTSVLKCLGGQRNCPPEDCGGFGGYKEILFSLDTIEQTFTEMLREKKYKNFNQKLEGDFENELQNSTNDLQSSANKLQDIQKNAIKEQLKTIFKEKLKKELREEMLKIIENTPDSDYKDEVIDIFKHKFQSELGKEIDKEFHKGFDKHFDKGFEDVLNQNFDNKIELNFDNKIKLNFDDKITENFDNIIEFENFDDDEEFDNEEFDQEDFDEDFDDDDDFDDDEEFDNEEFDQEDFDPDAFDIEAINKELTRFFIL